MDYILIVMVLILSFFIVSVVILSIIGLFVNIFQSNEKEDENQNNKFLWFGLGVLLGINLFD